MPTGGNSFEQSYNAQVAVDASKQIVVATLVSQSPKDVALLLPVVAQASENTGKVPTRVLADAGYRSEHNLAQLHSLEINGYVSLGREGKGARLPSAACPCTQGMLRKLKSKRGRAVYRKRKSVVEPVFGWVKRVMGFRTFSLRGLRKVAGEWSLVCMALNLRRMAVLEGAR